MAALLDLLVQVQAELAWPVPVSTTMLVEFGHWLGRGTLQVTRANWSILVPITKDKH
jgi:hypothetical protein